MTRVLVRAAFCLALSLGGSLGLRADDPKPDPAGIATGDKTTAADAAGNAFVVTEPTDKKAPDYAANKKSFDDYQAQAAKEPLALKLADSVGHIRVATNFAWTLNTGYLVLFMQAGFALLTCGLVRKKNAGHLMMLNFAAYVFAFIAYYAVGYAFQFGAVAINAAPTNLGGIPVAVMLAGAPPAFTSGTPGASTLTVNALDFDGQTITGNPFQNGASPPLPVSITFASSMPSVTLTATTLTGPGTTITANYSGAAVPCNAVVAITAAIGAGPAVPAGVLGINTGTPCGISIAPNFVSVVNTVGTQIITVTDPGYAGMITANAVMCIGNATISPASVAAGGTFTITGGAMATFPGPPCTMFFTDGTNTTPLAVTVT